METQRIVEIVQDPHGALATAALLRHYDRMELRSQEPSGEYTDVRVVTQDGVFVQKWPIPMPKREDHIILGEG
jgi:hypothetical protein